MLARLFLVLLLLAPQVSLASLYTCVTQLGESVPLRLGERPLNEAARALPGKSSVKKHEYSGLCLETRYLTQPGPSFSFELECRERCEGSLVGGEPLRFAPLPLLDTRVPTHGLISITSARREGFGLIMRVLKSAVPLQGGGTLPVSASGEHHFFREEEEFVFDVGADEYLFISEGVRHRLAALEVKVRCKRAKEHAFPTTNP